MSEDAAGGSAAGDAATDPGAVETGSGTDGDAPPGADPDGTAPSDAFGTLGSETRMETLETLFEGEPRTFSELFEASDVDTTAGFAYHLRQLRGGFVRKREDETYELTYAGRAVGRAVHAGTYTESVDRDPVPVEGPCPVCGEPRLEAAVTDNVTRVVCGACGSPLLALGLPPGGYATRSDPDVSDALESYHRRRIESFADGVCPGCAGAVTASMEQADAPGAPADDDTAPGDGSGDGDPTCCPDEADARPVDRPRAVRIAFECVACGASLRCPVSLAVLDHPAVVSFYHDHGENVRDRPLWNVGSGWRERVVSTDPWCVVAGVGLDDERLVLYVARDGTVVEHRRRPAGESATPIEPSEGADDSDDSDDPDDSGGDRPAPEADGCGGRRCCEEFDTDDSGTGGVRGDDAGNDDAATKSVIV